MKVVVTGGSGKIGQRVVRELLADTDSRLPHEVTVLDRLPGPDQGRVRYINGDIQDLGQVVGALAGADAVIHLAAIPRPEIATNEVVFTNNVLGTFNVHEAAWRLGIRRVVSTSSAAVLGWQYRERDFLPKYLPIDEDHPVQPQDCYGLSKAVGEGIARSYTEKSGMETVILRPPWVLLPDDMEQLRLRGGVQPTRFSLFCYIDVRDLAAAYRLAIERPLKGTVVLFITADDGSTAEPLNELFPRLLPSIGNMARDLTGGRPSISNNHAKKLLGWQPFRAWRRAH